MDLDAIRTDIAAAAPAGVTGYARPPGHIAELPAMVVQDPDQILYHTAHKTRHTVQIPVRVIVSRSAEQDTTAELDTLVSFDQIPATLEAATPTEWQQLVATGLSGGYADFYQDGEPVGISADIDLTLIVT